MNFALHPASLPLYIGIIWEQSGTQITFRHPVWWEFCFAYYMQTRLIHIKQEHMRYK